MVEGVSSVLVYVMVNRGVHVMHPEPLLFVGTRAACVVALSLYWG